MSSISRRCLVSERTIYVTITLSNPLKPSTFLYLTTTHIPRHLPRHTNALDTHFHTHTPDLLPQAVTNRQP